MKPDERPAVGHELTGRMPVPHSLGGVGWQEYARCRGQDPAMWVLGPTSAYVRQRAVCARCPVCTDCLESAIADVNLVGLWGGTDDVQRQVLRQAVVSPTS